MVHMLAEDNFMIGTWERQEGHLEGFTVDVGGIWRWNDVKPKK